HTRSDRDWSSDVCSSDLTFGTQDHNVPTTDRTKPIADPDSAAQIEMMRRNCRESGVRLFDLGAPEQGIVHVIGPELGLTQPGMRSEERRVGKGGSVRWGA